MPARINIPIGTRFGKLTVHSAAASRNGRCFWLCRCDCGETVTVASNSLRDGNTQSCGCRKVEMMTTHSQTMSPEYEAWRSLRYRCNRPTDESYERYGGRGITVCPEWDASFELFFKDVGPRPTPKHTVERIKNDGNYEPGNVRWATRREQNRNKRSNHLLTYQGRTLCISEWAEITSLKESTIRARLAYGWTTDKVLSVTPRNWGR